MPSGIVHSTTSLVLAAPCFALALGATGNDITMGLWCAGGCIAGIPLTPDLDQETLSKTEYTLIKYTLGLGFIWTMLWFPYALAIKHRSPLSHWPLLGTFIRLAYIGIFVAIALALGYQFPAFPIEPILWAVLGLVVSDTAHWLMDTLL
jgi:uncharacterized metal-binding protein